MGNCDLVLVSVGCPDFTILLRRYRRPDAGKTDHGSCVHQSVTKRVTDCNNTEGRKKINKFDRHFQRLINARKHNGRIKVFVNGFSYHYVPRRWFASHPPWDWPAWPSEPQYAAYPATLDCGSPPRPKRKFRPPVGPMPKCPYGWPCTNDANRSSRSTKIVVSNPISNLRKKRKRNATAQRINCPAMSKAEIADIIRYLIHCGVDFNTTDTRHSLSRLSVRYLFLAGRAAAVSGGQSGGTRFRIPRNVTVLCRAADAQRPDGIGVPVAVAIVVIPATIARSPDKDGALAAATLRTRHKIN